MKIEHDLQRLHRGIITLVLSFFLISQTLTHAGHLDEDLVEQALKDPDLMKTLMDLNLVIEVPQEIAEKSLSYAELLAYKYGQYPTSSSQAFSHKIVSQAWASIGGDANFEINHYLPKINLVQTDNIFLVGNFGGGCGGNPFCNNGKIIGVKCHTDVLVYQPKDGFFPRVSVEHPDVTTQFFKLGSQDLGNGKMGWWFQTRSNAFRWIKDGMGGHPEHGCHLTKTTLGYADTPTNPLNATNTSESTVYNQVAHTAMLVNPPNPDYKWNYAGPFNQTLPLLQDKPQVLQAFQKMSLSNPDAPSGELRKRVFCELEAYVQNIEVPSNPFDFEYKILTVAGTGNVSFVPSSTSLEQISIAGQGGATHSVVKVKMRTETYVSSPQKACLGYNFSVVLGGLLQDRAVFYSNSGYGKPY